jgi:hypothetical protein
VRVVLTSGGTLPTCFAGIPATSTGINLTVNPSLTATVTVSPSANPICSGTGVTFTAIPTNSGSTPTFQWLVNNALQVGNSNSFTYSPSNNDIVKAIVSIGGTGTTCVVNPTATSPGAAISVNGTINPSITLSASALNICTGTSVTINSSATGTGSAPVYHWLVNNVLQSNPSSSFTYSPGNNDQVKAVLVPGGNGLACVVGGSVTSSGINFTVNPIPTASVSILSSNASVCAGTNVSFTATGLNAGSSPTYQWLVNNIAEGNGVTFSYTPNNGDIVRATLVPGGTLPVCLATSAVTSNGINITVTPTVASAVTITASSSQVCSGTSVTLSATGTNVGSLPTYAWYVNGNPYSTGKTLTYVPANGDLAYAVVSSNGTLPNCLAIGIATSNGISLTVNPSLNPAISIIASNASVCSGTGVTFTAVGSNVGSQPTFTWFVNNNASSNGTTFSDVPNNGDAISAQVTAGGSLPNCISITTASSNVVPISVSSCLLPNPGSITGPAFVATGSSSVVYSVPNVTGNTYVWTVPTGAQIVSGQGTNTITVDFGSSPVTGTIGLQQTNANGSTSVSLNVSSGIPPTSTSISGPTIVTEGEQGVTYSISTVAGVTYQWSVPVGATISSGQGTGSVTVNFTGPVSGFVGVVQTNNYGTSSDSVAIATSLPTGGISSASFSEEVSLFPNPTSGTFQIKLGNGISDATITITDDKGVVQLVTNKLTDLGDNLSGGHYIVTIQTANGVKHLPLAKLR